VQRDVDEKERFICAIFSIRATAATETVHGFIDFVVEEALRLVRDCGPCKHPVRVQL
jgi:hypothetical protein